MDLETYEAEEAARLEERRLERLAALRKRMQIVSNKAAHTDAPEPELPQDQQDGEMSRTDYIRADRLATWESKVPVRWRNRGLAELPPDMRKEAMAWMKNHFPEGRNLILMGRTGSGKSSMAYAIAKELYLGGSKVKVWEAANLWENMRHSDESRQIFDSAKNCELLVLDELGAEKRSEWTDERLSLLVDHRWQWELPTIVGTNKNEDELYEYLPNRVYSRLMHGVVPLVVSGTDYRIYGDG